MSPQDIADGLAGNLLTQIGQGSDDSIVTPARILTRQFHHPLFDCRIDSRAAGQSAFLREPYSNEPNDCDNLEWMTRRHVLTLALALALALLSVSIDRGRTLRVVDIYGAPVEGVFVVYHHEGYRLNPAHATTYEASRRSIAQSCSIGRVEISPSVHLHWPFPIETHPGLRVDLVYAPAFHNGLATIGDRAIAQSGAFDVAGDLASVRLVDLSDSPALWEGTLRNLSAIIGRLISEQSSSPPRRRPKPDTTALTRVLAGHFAQEYGAFLDRYRNVTRPRPQMPAGLTEEERRAWNEMVDRDLAREPRWGDVAQRLFAREAERFASVESEPK